MKKFKKGYKWSDYFLFLLFILGSVNVFFGMKFLVRVSDDSRILAQYTTSTPPTSVPPTSVPPTPVPPTPTSTPTPTPAPCPNCSGGTSGSDTTCYAVIKDPPVLEGLVIKSNDGSVVNAELGSKNQICDPRFNGSRAVTFEISAIDVDDDITNIDLSWNGTPIPMIGGIGATTIFGWSGINTAPNSLNNGTIHPLIVTITDSVGNVTSNSSRNFKFWDCKVLISGNIYDATSEGGPVCPSVGFTNNPDKDILNFTSLVFQGDVDVDMTINSDRISYTSGSNGLNWGVGGYYIPKLNTDISLTNPKLKSKSSSAASPSCGWYIDTTNDVDPYSDSPFFIADFSGILIQDPWWQTDGGGVISNTSVSGRVPLTCINSCQIGVSGLVAAPTVSNKGKLISDSQTWYYSNALAKLANVNNNYSYFYNQYFVKKGVGTTLVGKTITSFNDFGLTPDPNNIYFINGNLIIDGDLINPNNFLMVIVNGNITVTQNVKRVDGILVANNIEASGNSDDQLIFNGSLFAFNGVNFSRDHITKLTNNSTPVVVVKYDPKLIFNIPGELAKVLINWQWGN